MRGKKEALPIRVTGAALALLLTAACGRPAPEAGSIEALFAEPPEFVQVHTLAAGETFSELMERAQLSLVQQQAVLLAFREQASPRRMRAGTEVSLRRRKSDQWLRAIDVSLSADETVELHRGADSWASTRVVTPTWTDTIFAAGTIEDVLWNAVSRNPGLESLTPGDRALLIHRMDQVFQWQVDFSRQIQQGDFYRFAFEREVRPDGTIRDATLIAAELITGGSSLKAIWFDPSGDGKGSYYDEEGRSVRRAFLRKPLEFRRISSRFNPSRYHPMLKRWRSHNGTDYAADAGTPIMATSDGVITTRGRDGGLGNAVKIQHANGFTTTYGHMSGFAAGQKVGSRVTQGEIIGYVGMTGLATGPHLHYELRRRGSPIDPYSVDLPAGDPVPEDAEELWIADRAARLALLERLPSGPEPTMATLTSAEVGPDGRAIAVPRKAETSPEGGS